MPKSDGASYLSGMVLGTDVGTAVSLLEISGMVHLICTPALAALYGKALARYDVSHGRD